MTADPYVVTLHKSLPPIDTVVDADRAAVPLRTRALASDYRGNHRLAGRRALITGGCNPLTRALVVAFAREGADVAIAYGAGEEDPARELADLVRAAGRRGMALAVDVGSELACQQLVTHASNGLCGLDILVNDVALAATAPEAAMQSLAWITRSAVAKMPVGSTIINTASFAAGGNPLDHGGTKAAIAHFSRGLSRQLVDRGIRVNVVNPEPGMDALPTFVRLASAESSYITGQVFGAAQLSGA